MAGLTAACELTSGPNAGKDFVLAVGGAERRFRLPATEQEIFIQLPTDGQQHELTIDVPAPTTPAAGPEPTANAGRSPACRAPTTPPLDAKTRSGARMPMRARLAARLAR